MTTETKTPAYQYYLTTRGLNNRGQILCLESMPPDFHRFVTVVSAKANKTAILGKYPSVQYWASPDSINSAAKKRTFVFQKAPDGKELFLLNDEIKLMVALKGKITPAREHGALFMKNILRMEELARDYVGISAATAMFNNNGVAAGVETLNNKMLGAFFHWKRSFADKKLKLGRIDYYEDIDYTLQALVAGYKTPNYLGILWSPRTPKPQRQNQDRTINIQLRDAKRLCELFPGFVSMKDDFNLEHQSYIINVRYAKAYQPKARVLFVCHGNINRSAAGEVILSAMRKTFDVRSCGVKDNAGGEITAKKTRLALTELGYPTGGIRSTKATKSLVGWADIVFYMDKGNLSRLTTQFPDSKYKFINLGSYIGLDKIDDPGFTSDPKVVMRVTKQILGAIQGWKAVGYPLPSENQEVKRGSLF